MARLPSHVAGRRAVLATILSGSGAALAGCVGRGESEDEQEREPGSQDDGSSTAPADATAGVTVTDVEPFAPERSIDATVEAVRPWVTDEEPAAIAISLTNRTGDVVELQAGDGDWAVLSDRASEERQPGVALLGEDVTSDSTNSTTPAPPAEHTENGSTTGDRTASVASADGCWRLSNDTANPRRVLNLTRIPAGETLRTRFEVWGHYENDPDVCLPTGEFTFGDSYELRSGPTESTFELSFSLEISAVE